MAKRTNRGAWGLVGGLTVVILGGIGLLSVWLKPYWVAKYQGSGADLRKARLAHAYLSGVNLRNAKLTGADLTRARLEGTCLIEADLVHAKLESARLSHAILTAADLRYADLARADLSNANLNEALLVGADLVDANLRGIRLLDAVCDRSTRWPSGFNPVEHGVRIDPHFDPRRPRLPPTY